MPSGVTEAWIALAGTVVGGSGLKFVEAFLSRKPRKIDTATELRTELRTELSSLREEVHRLDKSVDEWRDRYYHLLAKLADQGIHIDGHP